MGADTFMVRGQGNTAEEVFTARQRQARYDHGHGGYTGTIAEKGEFTVIPATGSDEDKVAFANWLIETRDPRVDDKWGPAGCIELAPVDGMRRFLFFGWASS